MLYLVATPIGNLQDITLRALETLKSVDYVASEDTRKTGLLLKHFDIRKPQIAFHEHNEKRAGDRLMALLADGKSVAVVTDAGTPAIADPGFTIVRTAHEAGIPVTMIPGPTALIMAVALSGLAVHSFTFRGFPPRKPGPRKTFLAIDRDSPHTLILYESPFRLEALLRDCLEVFGDRPAALANDLTKLFERVDRGSLSELVAGIAGKTLKGEFVVVIAGSAGSASGRAGGDREAELPGDRGPANRGKHRGPMAGERRAMRNRERQTAARNGAAAGSGVSALSVSDVESVAAGRPGAAIEDVTEIVIETVEEIEQT